MFTISSFCLMRYNPPAPPNHIFPFGSSRMPIIEIGILYFLNTFPSYLYITVLLVAIQIWPELSLCIPCTSSLLNASMSGNESIVSPFHLLTPPFPV